MRYLLLSVVVPLIACSPARPGPAGPPSTTRPPAAPDGVHHLTLDLHRSEGCSETFVSVRSRGRLTVTVSPHGPSRLTVELTEEERSGPRRRNPARPEPITTRGWTRAYRWEGKAGFLGSSAQLHLRPMGGGCTHQDLHGLRGGGCPATLPGLVVECTPARLADSPVLIRRRSPGAIGPADGHTICRVEVAGPRDRVRLPPDLAFLSRRLLLTRNGRPELVLRLVDDWDLIEGELRTPSTPRP